MKTDRRNFLTLAGNTFLFSHFPSFAWSQINNNKIYLIPANKNFEEKIFNIDEVQIQGALTGIIRKYN